MSLRSGSKRRMNGMQNMEVRKEEKDKIRKDKMIRNNTKEGKRSIRLKMKKRMSQSRLRNQKEHY